MKVVVQRVSQASVDVVNELGTIDPTFEPQQIGPGDPGLSDADLSADPGGTQHGTCELLRFCHLKAGYLLSCSLRHLQRPGASRIQEDRNLELPRWKLPDHPGLKQGGKK